MVSGSGAWGGVHKLVDYRLVLQFHYVFLFWWGGGV